MKHIVSLLAALAAVSPALADDRSADDRAAIVLAAKGVQIYNCARVADSHAWKLTAPEATLTDTAGREAGHHFAGPSWQATDGSIVVGEAMVASPAPGGGAIPWIVLRARDHQGEGRFAAVAYVVRSATAGGQAPSTGCDADHVGAETRVGYSATYTFFPGPGGR